MRLRAVASRVPTERARRRRNAVTWLLCFLLPLSFVFSLWYGGATAKQQRCESSNEFRGFLSAYLHDQADVGGKIEDSPGFDQLEPQIQQLLLLLAPAVTAGQEKDLAYATAYDQQFPILNCTLL